MDEPTQTEIFDHNRRQAFRARAARRGGGIVGGDMFLWRYMAQDLADRLTYVCRDFANVLIIGPMTEYADTILADRKIEITRAHLIGETLASAHDLAIAEDRLPFAPQSFDLIITAGTLDSVNDLPGTLIQMRRCLRPDGLMLCTMFGAGTLSTLKGAMMAADGPAVVPHIHPQIDLRSAADLLTRASFALPVADQDAVAVRYSQLAHLIADLRDMGVGNALSGARSYFGKAAYARLLEAWHRKAGADGKVEEQFNLINISGWAPSPDQPKPAKRGSASVSMASILGRKVEGVTR